MRSLTRILAAVLMAAVLGAGAGLALGQILPGYDRQKVTASGYRQKDLVALLKAMRNRTFGPPGLTFGSVNADRIRIQTATDHMIDGVSKTKAATDNIASSISGTALTATQEAYFRVEIDSAGAVTSVQGQIVTNNDCLDKIAPMPQRSALKATLGYIRVCRYSGGFTPATSTLNNAAVTFTDGDPDLSLDALES